MFPVEIWGTVGQWAGSLLSGLSLVLATNILRLDQRDKRRSQASLVTFTYTKTLDPDTDYANGVRGDVYNGSDLPITYARITVRSDKLSLSNAAQVQDPSVIVIVEVFSENESITVGPKRTASYHAPFHSGLQLQERDIAVELSFTDGNGRNWSRDASGGLVEHRTKYRRVRYTESHKPIDRARAARLRKQLGNNGSQTE
ncbi:hypothetical protein [Mycobacterium deserti]|uniref:Uncharacterized protein n=1 Tax=Mycobacterium deserti TaxID=2978347 RepID=A0ABT2M3J7_9MYCO|nr:hypothetical protein [Mycobacterium deserti]MCT7656838.1 hypothetical protein [Mycobacterium deserti]